MSTAARMVAAVALMRQAGVTVNYEPGWPDRGMGVLSPRGLVIHHTASPQSTGDMGVFRIVRDGHSGLKNLLSNWHLSRSGIVTALGAETAWHAGTGGWRGITGNSQMLGCEWECDGIGERASAGALRSYVLLAAACCKAFGFPPDNVCFHREWTTRKVDPRAPNFPEPDEFRRQVTAALTQPEPEPDMDKEQFFAWMDEYNRRPETKARAFSWLGEYFRSPQTEGGKSLLALIRTTQSNSRRSRRLLRAIAPKLGVPASAEDPED